MSVQTGAENNSSLSLQDGIVSASDESGDPTLTNRAPTDLALSAATVAENAATGTVIGTLSATDADGDALTYTLTDNAGGRFALETVEGVTRLVVAGALNHESAASHGISLSVSDGKGGSLAQDLTIAVSNVDEAPTGLRLSSPITPSVTAIAVAENAPAGTVVATLSATDPEGGALTYRLTDDADGLFELVGSELRLTRQMADFETATLRTLPITVEASDAVGNATSATFTLRHADAYDAPEGRLVLDASGAAAGVDFASFITDYFDGLTRSTAFYGGTPVASVYGPQNQSGEQIMVTLSENGTATDKRVLLQSAEGTNLAYDFLTYGPSLGHGISGALDSLTFGTWVEGTTTGTVGIGDAGLVTNLLEQIRISGFDLQAEAGSGHVSALNLLYAIYNAASTGNAAGLYQAMANYAQDFIGSAGADSFTGSAHADSILGGAGDDTLSGAAGDDTLDGGAGSDTAVFTGAEADYSLTRGADGRVTVTDNRSGEASDGTDILTGFEQVQFSDGTHAIADLLPETPAEDPVGSLILDASGATSGLDLEAFLRGGFIAGGGAATSSSTADGASLFTYDSLGRYVLFEGDVEYYFPRHTMVGEIDSIAYGVTGASSAELRITGLNFANVTPTTAEEELEIETNGTVHNFYSAHFNMDGGAFDEVRLNRYADQLDDYAQTFIGSAFADRYTGTRFDDTITGGGGNDTLNGGDGTDTLVLNGIFGGPTGSYSFSGGVGGAPLVLTDSRSTGGTGTDTLTNIEVLRFANLTYNLSSHAVNYTPTDLALAQDQVSGSAAIGTVVSALTVTDRDAGDTHSFTLLDNANGRFALQGNTIRVAGTLQEEAYTLRVRATDSAGNSFDKDLTIRVDMPVANTAPTAPSLSANRVAENAARGTVVGTLSASDADGDALSYALTNSAGGRFALVTSGGVTRLVVNGALDHETDASHTVTVAVSDGQGHQTTRSLSIAVTDVNEAPRITSHGAADTARLTHAENASNVTRLIAQDVDEGASLTWSISGGADRSLFAINAQTGALTFRDAPDFEAPSDAGRNNVYDVTVSVSDGRLSDRQALAIRVTDQEGKTLNGNARANSLTGTGEEDRLSGKGGADTLSGKGGDDKLWGGAGKDRLLGGGGDDLLKGGAGADTLLGGAGSDDLYGGAGADVFVFRAASHSTLAASGRDTIHDFKAAAGDLIDLRAIDADKGQAGNQGFTFIGRAAFTGEEGELRFTRKAADTFVYGDVNGDGNADFALHLDGSLALKADHFLL